MYNYGVKLKEIKEAFSAEVFKEKEFRLIHKMFSTMREPVFVCKDWNGEKWSYSVGGLLPYEEFETRMEAIEYVYYNLNEI
ncbi:MAG: hypothetical protein ACRCZ9_04520 [Fusobacteriaceae bacterium]